MYLKGNLRHSVSSEPSYIDVYQENHGFETTVAVRIDGSGIYYKAQADNKENAEVIGFAIKKDNNNFRLYIGGKVEGFSGLTVGKVYFLSSDLAGEITDEEPEEIDLISKPILIADSETSGIFYNMRGLLIGHEFEGTDHSLLENLDYENSGHTGFQKKLEYDCDFKAYEIK